MRSVLILLVLARGDGGCIVGDCKNGHGVYAEGERKYDGEWKDGLQHGRGTFYFAAGEKYEGDWRDGKPNGRGVKTYADGRRYDGEWKDNVEARVAQQLQLDVDDGASYEGDWGLRLVPRPWRAPIGRSHVRGRVPSPPVPRPGYENLRGRAQAAGRPEERRTQFPRARGRCRPLFAGGDGYDGTNAHKRGRRA